MSGPSRPHILLLATGGTIASEIDGAGRKCYESARGSTAALLNIATGAGDFDICGEQIAAVGSQDIGLPVWRALAARIVAGRRKVADAVVVTHGTDTLEETAFLLDLLLPADRPVVLTGAMRAANLADADGPQNLIAAIRVAADPAARDRGVLVVMHGAVHAARDVTKLSTSARDAFQSPSRGAIGAVSPAGASFFAPSEISPLRGRYRLPADTQLPRVDILYGHADADAACVDALIAGGCAGIVLAGLGDGNAPAPVLAGLARAAAGGLLVIRATRIAGGRADRGGEVDDTRLGLVAARDISPHKARILAQLLITTGVTDPVAAQAAFDVC